MAKMTTAVQRLNEAANDRQHTFHALAAWVELQNADETHQRQRQRLQREHDAACVRFRRLARRLLREARTRRMTDG